MTVTLQLVNQFSINNTLPSAIGNNMNRSLVLNTAVPIIVFDFNTTDNENRVGYIQGNTAYMHNISTGTGGANLLVRPAPLFSPFGYNKVMAGGQVCGNSGCMQNGISSCGPWYLWYDISAQQFTINCTAQPTNNLSVGLWQILIDNNYVYFIHGTTTEPSSASLLIWRIPVSDLGTLLNNNQFPSSAQWAHVQPPGLTTMSTYRASAFILNNVLYISGIDGNNSSITYIYYVNLSQITWNSGTPGGSPQEVGAYKSIQLPAGAVYQPRISPVYDANYNVFIAYLAVYNNGQNITFKKLDTSLNVIAQQDFQGPFHGYSEDIRAGLGVSIYTQNGSTSVYVFDYRAFPQQLDSALAQDGANWSALDPTNLMLITAQPDLASNPFTLRIYQILVDVLPVFQNVQFSISGNNTLTVTGRLVNLNGNTAVSNATVKLIAVYSYRDFETADSSIIGTGTTDANGNFSISGTIQSGVKLYAVKYVPS